MKTRQKLLVIAAVATAIILAAHFLPLSAWAFAFVEWVHKQGVLGAVIYALAYVLGTVILFSGLILTTGSGFLYGPLWGTVLASPASVAGATLSFLLGRSVARPWVEKRISQDPKFAAVSRAIERNGFKIVLLLRLVPVIPFALLNYGLGLTKVRPRDYILASWLGMLPATALYVYLGSAAHNLTELIHGGVGGTGRWGQGLFCIGLAAAIALIIVITRIARAELAKELENDPSRTRVEALQ